MMSTLQTGSKNRQGFSWTWSNSTLSSKLCDSRFNQTYRQTCMHTQKWWERATVMTFLSGNSLTASSTNGSAFSLTARKRPEHLTDSSSRWGQGRKCAEASDERSSWRRSSTARKSSLSSTRNALARLNVMLTSRRTSFYKKTRMRRSRGLVKRSSALMPSRTTTSTHTSI